MDKIRKFLKKLTASEREALMLVLLQIEKDPLKIPGITKLEGSKDLYRVRVGRYRIIFKIQKTGPKVIRISKRDEQTYKHL